MTPMPIREIVTNVKNSLKVKGFEIQHRERNKFFSIKRNITQSAAKKEINKMLDLVDYLTLEDQMNGERIRTVTYALLNESGKFCDGFSFLVK